MNKELLCRTCKHGESLGTQKTKDDVEVEFFSCWYKQDTEGKERSGRCPMKMEVTDCDKYDTDFSKLVTANEGDPN